MVKTKSIEQPESNPSGILRPIFISLFSIILNLIIANAAQAHPDTIGVYRPSNAAFFLRNSNTAGLPETTAIYGAPNWIPIVGDWDGNGTTTIGAYEPGRATFFLRNSNTAGLADIIVSYGAPNWIPIVGDWDGNGTITIGAYDPSTATFFLRNSNTQGFADIIVIYGAPNWIPIVGDWDGNGTTTIGAYEPGTGRFFLRNSNTQGFADVTVAYGAPNWLPVVGDWDGNGTITIGAYEPGTTTFFLRNSNTAGLADVIVPFGATGDWPIAGKWCNLSPSGDSSGQTDWSNINSVLQASRCVTLASGTFYINQPIQAVGFPAGVSLTGAGKNQTKIYPVFVCGDSRFVDGDGRFRKPIEVRHSPNTVVSGFHLDLEQLRSDCGHLSESAIVVDKSDGVQVINIKITGSQYGSAGYTTGWGRGAGIAVRNSANTIVRDNSIKDLGFLGDPFAGGHAIEIRNSGNARVENNFSARVAWGVVISNFSPTDGNFGDSSGTIVTGNDLGGASLIGCPTCGHGRGIKLQACEHPSGDELPLQHIIVTNNTVTDFGGQASGVNAGTGGTGLMLVCGVQYSRFENNTFIGSPYCEWGLSIDSSFLPCDGCPRSLPKATHHNIFNNNTFRSGRGQSGCDAFCFDVIWQTQGPDQIGISRGSQGTNIYTSVSRNGTGAGCSQYAHAFFLYPSGQNFVSLGQSITLAAAGVRPPSLFSVVLWEFKTLDDSQTVATFVSQRSNSNCVVNQQDFLISAAQFSPGFYKVYASYYDGNSDVYIPNDLLHTTDNSSVLTLEVR